MSNQTVKAPSPAEARAAAPARRCSNRRADRILRPTVLAWALSGVGLLVLSLALIGWARTRPGYDPYGWLVWGRLAIRLKLDTNGAPSWKPLPFLFTVPYALFGRYQLWLWMLTAVAVSLSGPLLAWRIAFRLTAAEPARRYAAYIAGAFAAAFVLLMQDSVGRLTYIHYVLSSESDTMIVALCLAAIDCHLASRHRWGFWAWWLAALGRPEVWPVASVAAIVLWVRAPDHRRWLVVAVALQLFLWFGIPALTSKSAFTAGNIAHNSPRAVRGAKITGTLRRFHDLEPNTVWITAGLTTLVAAVRRNLAVLTLAAGALSWLVIEVAFALGGFPSVPRYLFEPGAVVSVLAAVLIGRLVLVLPPLISGATGRIGAARAFPELARRAGGWGTAVVILAIAASVLPAAHRRYQLEALNLTHERARTVLIARLRTVVSDAGSGRILACGQPHIPIAYQSVLAWYLDIKIGELYVDERHLRRHPHTLVNIYPASGLGWRVFPSYVTSSRMARCQALRRIYR